ncbi:MAG: twin-arginine translocation signal domain-containing protein, partial [Chloroflexota bacterium]
MTRKISRRQFLGEASCASVGSASLFSTLLNMRMTNTAAAFQASSGQDDDYKAMVCLFLAGGNDSFNMLVPA